MMHELEQKLQDDPSTDETVISFKTSKKIYTSLKNRSTSFNVPMKHYITYCLQHYLEMTYEAVEGLYNVDHTLPSIQDKAVSTIHSLNRQEIEIKLNSVYVRGYITKTPTKRIALRFNFGITVLEKIGIKPGDRINLFKKKDNPYIFIITKKTHDLSEGLKLSQEKRKGVTAYYSYFDYTLKYTSKMIINQRVYVDFSIENEFIFLDLTKLYQAG